MTLPSASWPNERPPDPDGEGDAASGEPTPPAGAVSLADLIADSGPLPADAALECVQRIAERLTAVAHPFRSDLAPADVLVDDDGGVWIRESAAAGSLDLNRSASRSAEMDRLGRLLAFVATGDGAHLADGAEFDPATLPPPLSTVAGRLFSRNGACYLSYADLARDAADLRQISSDALVEEQSEPSLVVEDEPLVAHDSSPIVAAADASLVRVDTPAVETASHDGSPRLVVTMLVVFLLAAGVAFVIWQLL